MNDPHKTARGAQATLLCAALLTVAVIGAVSEVRSMTGSHLDWWAKRAHRDLIKLQMDLDHRIAERDALRSAAEYGCATFRGSHAPSELGLTMARRRNAASLHRLQGEVSEMEHLQRRFECRRSSKGSQSP